MKSHIKSIFHIITLLPVLVVLIGSIAFPSSANAFGATITVTSILDNATTDGFCSLREAITNANNNAATSSDCAAGIGADAIVFSDLLVVHTVTLGSTLPGISDAAGLTIYGDDTFTVSGNNLYRVFIVNGSASLTLDSLTVANGRSVSGTGAGVFNAAGTLTLTNCFFSENSSVGSFGGGIYNVGALTITDSIFSNNNATNVGGSGGRGGAIYNASGSTATITRTIFSENSADIRGGGIYNYFSSMNLTDSMVMNNSTTSAGGPGGQGGGGIYNDQSSLTITHSSFSFNETNFSGSNAGGIFNDQGTLDITLSTFFANSVSTGGVGGAIATNGTVSIANSTFASNYAEFGAGIYNGSGGTLTVTNNTFTDNVGGGIINQAVLNLYNSILANSSSGDDCVNNGTMIGSNNLIEATSTNACGLINGTNDNITGVDPALGAATLINPVYFPLTAGSPAINAGDDVKCAVPPINNTSQNGIMRPQGAHCDIGSFELSVSTLAFTSLSTNDGWILESTETSGAGGTMNSTATTFNLGDATANRQYRAVLHFDTSSLPDTAIITSAALMIKRQGVAGTNPFTILGNLRVDMRKPGFGTAALALADFKSAAGKNNVSTFGVTPVGSWYAAILNSTGNLYINRTGPTQFRLYFTIDDNNDNGNDFMKFFSGNSGAANRPQLIVTYVIP